MSNKQDLLEALKALALAKKKTADEVTKAVEETRQARQAAREAQNRQQ
ncbi:hypothetical protein ES703_88162 [subsurface metagenome]